MKTKFSTPVTVLILIGFSLLTVIIELVPALLLKTHVHSLFAFLGAGVCLALWLSFVKFRSYIHQPINFYVHLFGILFILGSGLLISMGLYEMDFYSLLPR